MIRCKFWILLFVIAICDASVLKNKEAKSEECVLDEAFINEIAGYADAVKKIHDYFTGEFKGETYNRIADFVDLFGHRLSGSKALEDSIDYMIEKSIEEGLQNVNGEEVEVPSWVRGNEYATMIEPHHKNMPMLGLGYSVSTPREGLEAEGIVVANFDELDTLNVTNKIVIYDYPFTEYYDTVRYRSMGALRAAEKGAVAALVRSVTQFSIATPHTGNQNCIDPSKCIPTAAITHEDADFLRREQERGHKIRILLHMPATLEQVKSRNMVAELPGREPDEHIIISGHIDSWDVGDGSMDDAGGCFIAWLAPIALKALDLIPKRTIRNVLFTAEEQGLHGAIQYKAAHEDESDKLVFLMESDFGTWAPLGLAYEGSELGECMLREILKLFDSIGATELVLESPAPDISIWTQEGWPGAGLHNANDKYFWYHHTEGDRLNVLDSDTMDINGAFWASVAYIVADMERVLPRDPRP